MEYDCLSCEKHLETGCLGCNEKDKNIICPVCGSDDFENYYELDGDIAGCDGCITQKPWYCYGDRE